ncbi:unnamed protein product [Closterium sp. Naga37s-1]|nr:unnamed protein product [Closterium sp. Naga37s-1]
MLSRSPSSISNSAFPCDLPCFSVRSPSTAVHPSCSFLAARPPCPHPPPLIARAQGNGVMFGSAIRASARHGVTASPCASPRACYAVGSLNKFQGQHPLRERAKKLGDGILVIRFEMPFHVWCGGCKSMIAKGVRFNAEKKHIANYLSTKIWSFKMRAACCQHEIEIHTDPKNCDYLVVSGAERKVVEYDAEDAGTVELPSKEEREQLLDPLVRLEHGGRDRKRAAAAAPTLAAVKAAADTKHADPFRLNRVLRSHLRERKKRVAEEEAEARSRGLAIRLLPPSQADSAAAAAAPFAHRFDHNRAEKRTAIRSASIFTPSAAPPATPASAAAAGSSSHKRHKPEGKQQLTLTHKSSSSSKISSRSSGGEKKADVAKRAELLAKRRRIDVQGVLALTRGQL